jgi:spermidine export protein MdtJ
MTTDLPSTTALEERPSKSLGAWRVSQAYIAWLFLALAVTSEVCGLAVMKLSVSMGHVEGMAVLYLLVALSYVFLAKAVKSISIGVAYAIWEGSGIALITIVSAFAFQQYLTLRETLGLSMVVVGIWMIHAGKSNDE